MWGVKEISQGFRLAGFGGKRSLAVIKGYRHSDSVAFIDRELER